MLPWWPDVTIVQQSDVTIVVPWQWSTGHIHDYLFCYCPLVDILFEPLRIALRIALRCFILYNLPIFVLHNIVFNVLSDNKHCCYKKLLERWDGIQEYKYFLISDRYIKVVELQEKLKSTYCEDFQFIFPMPWLEDVSFPICELYTDLTVSEDPDRKTHFRKQTPMVARKCTKELPTESRYYCISNLIKW